ncbi:MAG: hypothetical protein ACR2RL_00795 [Gammaproteobacteria bacterium]
MSKKDKEIMMDTIMQTFFAHITPEEKQKMMADIMPRMMEGMNMTEMMPKMMAGMTSGGAADGPGGMQAEMGKMMHSGSGHPMPEMMPKMMPNCIGMMLPSIEPDKRSEAAEAVLSAIVQKGSVGMSEEQRQSFFGVLEKALDLSTRPHSDVSKEG